MDFTKALAAKTTEERDDEIETQVYDHGFAELLDEGHMEHGGFPSDVEISGITIYDREDEVVVTVEVSFTETVSTACADIGMHHGGSAEFQIIIDKASGYFETIAEKIEISDDFRPGDYY